ncbi:MAG: glycosyltransferase, partial [Ferruginibacter sp.]|nr:glycosyltransferase [Ferruginibacter sp.]
MKILMVMDPGILVPPVGYGGIERLVEIFAIEYKKLGHEVHLLVTPGSYVEGCIVHPFGKEGFPPKKKDARKAIPIAWRFLWRHRNYFDLVHSFGRLAYLLPIMGHPVKKIMTYQREIDGRNIRWVNRLRCNNMFFTACSKDLLSRIEGNGNWAVVYNAVSFDKYSLSELVPATAPLIFLGRIERIKGCHTAIQLAKRTNNTLVIAGNISALPKEIDYFENEIKPFIDGKQIIYVGALNDEQKNQYLGAAKALVFPIEWNEPFGIVMIEAMACGTPVIAFNKGSVTEVIDEGITGFKVDSFAQMELAVKKLDTFDRASCRARAKSRFDAPQIALQYLDKVHKNSKQIVIVTTGQPAANPRALKEYQALKDAGYQVKMIYSYSLGWSHEVDEEKFKKKILTRNDFIQVGGNPKTSRARYFMSRFVFKIFEKIRWLPIPFIKYMVTARSSFSLWLGASRIPADLYIAHYPGALPAARKAAKKHNALLIFDAEDFHRGETPEHRYHIPQAIYIENRFLPSVDLMTVASPLIGNAYK